MCKAPGDKKTKRIWVYNVSLCKEQMRTCVAHYQPLFLASMRLVYGALGMVWLIFSPRTSSPRPDSDLCVAVQEICFVYPLAIGTHYRWPFLRFDTGSRSLFTLSGCVSNWAKPFNIDGGMILCLHLFSRLMKRKFSRNSDWLNMYTDFWTSMKWTSNCFQLLQIMVSPRPHHHF